MLSSSANEGIAFNKQLPLFAGPKPLQSTCRWVHPAGLGVRGARHGFSSRRPTDARSTRLLPGRCDRLRCNTVKNQRQVLKSIKASYSRSASCAANGSAFSASGCRRRRPMPRPSAVPGRSPARADAPLPRAAARATCVSSHRVFDRRRGLPCLQTSKPVCDGPWCT